MSEATFYKVNFERLAVIGELYSLRQKSRYFW